ncbi:hypothetical protein XELAEV_18014661mg [Xenopus laevis]|uniref:Uncharacterized protein n=1 Tax=Xenopus laevis TaxID=8355 RepID=A0A974DII2_XENLA|nr:hypothetical protein XELAEV_18014661mg [Xenopus laevis]
MPGPILILSPDLSGGKEDWNSNRCRWRVVQWYLSKAACFCSSTASITCNRAGKKAAIFTFLVGKLLLLLVTAAGKLPPVATLFPSFKLCEVQIISHF